MRILAATNNGGKLKELKRLMGGLEAEVLALADFPQIGEIEENGESFIENAKIKAKAAGEATGLLTIADDSGLQVDALGGAPGIMSARYAGFHGDDEANNTKLLSELEGVPLAKRQGQFVCAVAIYVPPENGKAEQIYTVEGTCPGIIALEKKGEGGFGYDPLFIIAEFNKTMAELSPQEKNSISHRGKAMKSAVEILEGLV